MYTSKVSRCFRLDSSFSETYFAKAVSCQFEWPSIIVDLPAVFHRVTDLYPSPVGPLV